MFKNPNRTMGLIVSTVFFALAIAGYYAYRLAGEIPSDAFTTNGQGPNAIATEQKIAQNVLIKKGLEEVDQNGLSKVTAVITTARGKIKIKFYTKDAPRTVERIAELVHNDFYNGLIFHRVEPQFVIQGGDPTGTGQGGSGSKLPAEFNSRKHIAGTVSMARTQDPNSADSQFFICLGTHAFLDHNYTVFGQVIEGQEVANQIQVGDRMTTVALEME